MIGGPGTWAHRSLRPSTDHLDQKVVAPIVVVAVAALGGLAVAVAPVATVIGVGGTLALLGLVSLGRRSSRAFLVALGALLLTYAFLNKGGAYVGISPIYVSELVLGVGVVALAFNADRLRLGIPEVLLVGFMVLGAARTIPYVGTYGLDALRDGVTWAYGLFAFIVFVTIRSDDFPKLVDLARRLIPWFLAWVPVLALATFRFGDLLPRFPGPLGGVSVLYFNNGHIAVQLAAIGSFTLVGLYAVRGRGWLAEPLMWALWLFDLALVGALNRGSLLAASMAATAALFVRRPVRWAQAALVGLTLLAVVALMNPVIDLGVERKVSVDQLVANLSSVFAKASNDNLEGTERWRLAWWDTIVGYTVDGPYFWTGKGFGINLADDDGFQVTSDGSLRAPHNSHIEILARMGVPGLALWVLFQAAYAITLLRSAFRARRHGLTSWLQIQAVLFAYWAAAMVNTSFDPYLEGPHGGIWFWAMIGLGLATTRAVREEIDRIPEPSTDPTAVGTRSPAIVGGAPRP